MTGEGAIRSPGPARQAGAGALGSFFLFATVVGSGIMAERLAGGNVAVALLGNTLATAAILFVLIVILAPVSGAQMNPAVSLVAALRRDLAWGDALLNILAQLGGGLLGVAAAHLMFDLPILQVSERRGLESASGRANSSPPSA
jgi:glycerol uptake facilitator-like aquaporin